jgi:hypothetical protein
MATTKLVASVLAAAAGVIAACVGCGEPPPVDMSLLTGEPCVPPCWQGLTPGASTQEEADEFLRTNELVDTGCLYQSDITLGSGKVVGVSLQWWSSANTAGVRREYPNEFRVKDGILQEIAVFLDCRVTVEDLLTRHGRPHRWEVQWVSLDTADIDVFLYYPSRGFTARVRLPSLGASLDPASRVREVRYLAALNEEDFLSLGSLAGYFPADEVGSLREWGGYGPVNP